MSFVWDTSGQHHCHLVSPHVLFYWDTCGQWSFIVIWCPCTCHLIGTRVVNDHCLLVSPHVLFYWDTRGQWSFIVSFCPCTCHLIGTSVVNNHCHVVSPHVLFYWDTSGQLSFIVIWCPYTSLTGTWVVNDQLLSFVVLARVPWLRHKWLTSDHIWCSCMCGLIGTHCMILSSTCWFEECSFLEYTFTYG